MQADQRLAVVTGSNTGIGLEIARGLARLGVATVVTSRSKERALAAVTELRSAGEDLANLHAQQLDVDDDASVDEFVSWVQSTFSGGVSYLINNAAIAFKAADPTPFEGQTGPTLRTNVFQTVKITQKMLPLLNQNTTGAPTSRVVFMASQAGTYALSGCSKELQDRWVACDSLEGMNSLLHEFSSAVESGSHRARGWPSSNYGVSKLAVITAAKAYARELGPKGIVVTSVCPGHCATSMSSFTGQRSAAKGAETPVWLAAVASPEELQPGGFYFDKKLLR